MQTILHLNTQHGVHTQGAEEDPGKSGSTLDAAVWDPARVADIDDKLSYWIAKKNRAPEMLEDEEFGKTWSDATKGAYQPPDHTKHKKNVSRMAHKGLEILVEDNKTRREEGE